MCYEYTKEVKTKIPLKPCPFCGKKAVMVIDDLGQYVVHCTSPFCAASLDFVDTEEDAAKLWNRRRCPFDGTCSAINKHEKT